MTFGRQWEIGWAFGASFQPLPGKWRKLGRPLALLAIVLLCGQLGGCISPAVQPPAAAVWMTGKISVVNGEKGFSARFTWAQRGEELSIDLWGPLGQGRTRLRGAGQYFEILGGDGGVLASGRPQALMQEQLGWSLPLGLLLDWVNGRPSAMAPAVDQVSDVRGRLTGFSQLGWQVRYNRFTAFAEGALPVRISIERPGRRVRVVISERRL